MRSIAHHDYGQLPERMKFLRIIFDCPEGARKWRISCFAMLLHSKNTGQHRLSGIFLQKGNTRLFTGFQGVLIPNAGLHLANVGAAHHQHGKTGLSDTAANGQRQLAV